MWSLPDISRLNASAAANANQLKREVKRKRKPKCEHHDCNCRADVSFLIYDIFSDDPKGILNLCEHHTGYSGNPAEGYFTCSQCQRVMVENYTWERYEVELGGETVCLKCAAEAHFSNQDNWIDPRQVKSVVLDPDIGPLFDSESGVLNVARCPHVLGVEQPLPAGVRFFENAEFDNTDGHQISGRHLLDLIQDLDRPFVPVLDAAYQFAVSIGLYVRAADSKMRQEAA